MPSLQVVHAAEASGACTIHARLRKLLLELAGVALSAPPPWRAVPAAAAVQVHAGSAGGPEEGGIQEEGQGTAGFDHGGIVDGNVDASICAAANSSVELAVHTLLSGGSYHPEDMLLHELLLCKP